MGCVNFSATATDRGQVSELLRVLENDPLFIGPFTSETGGVCPLEPANRPRSFSELVNRPLET